MATKKPSAAQIAARKKFSDIMKAGGFAKKRAAKKTVAKKAVAKKRVTKKNPANVSYRSKPIEDSTAKQLRQWLGETAQFMTDKELNAFKSEAIILGYGKFEPAQIPADVYFKLLRYAQGASRRKNPTILITDTPKKRTVIRRVNPVAKRMSVSKRPAILSYSVQYKEIETQKWDEFARYKYKEDAKKSAYALAEEYPEFIIRVMSYKNGAM
jgi:hypothetical protein